MGMLTGKKMVVIGGTGSVGRRIVERGAREGATVLAVARNESKLEALAAQVAHVDIMALDASQDSAQKRVFGVMVPDVLVIASGVFPPTAPLYDLTWEQFGVNWEADVKTAFHFVKAALSLPLSMGSSVIVISSGAAFAGSPLSGGYAGSKRTQVFLTNYGQKESDRLGLGLRFKALAPRIMPDTGLGDHAAEGYSRYLGVSKADFIASMDAAPSASDVATAAIDIAADPGVFKDATFIVSGKGLQPVQQ